ncbi:hypothetical protein N7474_008725, partial [Penicillium riverlandense]|uniref:uncharacterized protein n=1 Tax=Penicillium riverlandense TaxID=1903569 RepID=UPI0025471838
DLFQPSPPWHCHEPEYVDREVPVKRMPELPDVSIINEYVAAYYESPIRLSFPVIDHSLFSNTLHLGLQNSSNLSSGRASSRACLCAFLSLSAFWGLHEKNPVPIDSLALVSKAEKYIPQILQEETLDGLQAILMLMIFHCSSGNFRKGLYLDSLTARLIFRFGAHVMSPPTPGGATSLDNGCLPQMGSHLRNLFWIAYSLDKELSIRTGQPAAIQDEVCDLTVPQGYGDQLSILLSSGEHGLAGSKDYLYPVDLRLIKIKSRAYSAFYGPGCLCMSDIDLFKTIRGLDNDLEEWRLSIPSNYRPKLSTSQKITTGNHFFGMHAVLLQMDYYNCVAIIHQACGRCVAWASNQSSIVSVGSSFTLAVESSRSSLLSLKNHFSVLPRGTFWPIVFYPLSACLTIFCNIVLDPTSLHAAQDLELLDYTSTLITGLSTAQFQLPKSVHICRLESLVTELSELAKVAVTETQKDQPLS